jgi:hypothetical protein
MFQLRFRTLHPRYFYVLVGFRSGYFRDLIRSM